jgi:hypothetical protein
MKLIAALLIAIVFLAGCEPEKIGPVGAVNVMTPPAAVSFDADKIPDGVQARIFMYRRSSSDSSSVVNVDGCIEIMMYDGNARFANLDRLEPLHVWRFTADELKAYERKWLGQLCYRINLVWGRDRPTKSLITLRVKYTAANGQTTFSAPHSILSGM